MYQIGLIANSHPQHNQQDTLPILLHDQQDTAPPIVTEDINQVWFLDNELNWFQDGLQNLIATRKTGPDFRNVVEDEDGEKQ